MVSESTIPLILTPHLINLYNFFWNHLNNPLLDLAQAMILTFVSAHLTVGLLTFIYPLLDYYSVLILLNLSSRVLLNVMKNKMTLTMRTIFLGKKVYILAT